jgi:hypothetical protein
MDLISQKNSFSFGPPLIPPPPANSPPPLSLLCLRSVADAIRTVPQKLEMLPQDIINKLLSLMSFVSQTMNDTALYSCLTSKLYELSLTLVCRVETIKHFNDLF